MSSGRNIAYVAARMIPPSKPPASTAGPIPWLRRNLFNGVVDSVLTLFSIILVVWLVPPLVDWAFLKGVWNANSLDECREIIVANHGEDARGACWAFINERLHQFLFGFYPPELYWRPTLAFALLFVALAPVLFSQLPRQMLWFSAIYPIAAFVLIWGGFGIEAVSSAKIGGGLLTIIIAVGGIAIAILLGLVLALLRHFSILPIRVICAAMIEFFRGVPLIVLIFAGVVLLNYFLPPLTFVDLILRAVILVALPSGAYMAEAIRNGIVSIPRGQWEAAAALGFGYGRAIWLIILPQALRIATPRIVRASVGLFRDTSLVAMIGLLDPVGFLNPIRTDSTWHGILWELYAVVILFYWVFCFSISCYSKYFERTRKSGH